MCSLSIDQNSKQHRTLHDMCHEYTDVDGNSFVGVKADTNGMNIYFPIGYDLPKNENDLRVEVHNLLSILATFKKEEEILEEPNFSGPISVDFPMHAYIQIIRKFLNAGHYYIETDPHYGTATKGTPDWPRTFRQQLGLVQRNGSIIFTKMTVRKQKPNANKQITQIHQYCVHEAFSKLGAIYVAFVPEKPARHPSITESISILTDKINHTPNDNDRFLFQEMKQILTYMDSHSENDRFFFGTDRFEYVWQNMIDTAFGEQNKRDYFPKSTWLLDSISEARRKRTSLQPDSIMIYNGKYYVLDSKYYRYGWTAEPSHLPGGPDINKQITYGEYIERSKSIPDDKLYNAFIMPYNSTKNFFKRTGDIENIGEAIGNWRYDSRNPHMKNYERVQGIVIDTRFLMNNYLGSPIEQKKQLADAIEQLAIRPNITPSIFST